MKTYEDRVENVKYRYFYDASYKSWVVIEVDENKNQVGQAEYFANKQSLLANYPSFKFKRID